VQLGFLLAQGSEFVFVIIAMPMVRAELGEAMVGVIVTGIAASLMLTPGLVSMGKKLTRILKLGTTTVASAETVPGTSTAPVIVFGMNVIGRSVADALEAHDMPYDAIDSDHDRFLAASADGYPMAFGDPGDVRLMETLAYAEREAIVITIINREKPDTLKLVMHDRYPNLTCFIAVENEADKAHFEGTGLRAVVNRSVPCGLDLAAAVLRHQRIDEGRIKAWMRRQHERALQDSAIAPALVTG